MSDTEERKESVTEEKKQGEQDDDEVDENVFNQANDLMEDNVEQNFQCINPQMAKGHIAYTCRGADENGFWQENRRFNHFYKLH